VAPRGGARFLGVTTTIETLPALRLVGLRCFGRPEELPLRLAPAWQEMLKRAPEIAGRLDPELFYGARPESHIVPGPADGVFIYWVCVRIAPSAPFPKGLGQLLIPAGRYVIGTPDTETPLDPERWAVERYDEKGVLLDELRPVGG
jgi:predicted transcriptional regulator YdeE